MRPARIFAVVAAVAVFAVIAPAVGPAATAGPGTTSPAGAELLVDPAFSPPSGPLSDAELAAIDEVLRAQETALENLQPSAYLSTFIDAPPGSGVAGDHRRRAEHHLFAGISPGSELTFAGLSPVFCAPGPDGTVDVLVRHVVLFRDSTGSPSLVDYTAMERMRRDDGGRWRVYDWFEADEKASRLSWLLWVRGRVRLEPFSENLQAEITYHLFPGFPDADSDLVLRLADTFEVTGVTGQGGDIPWRRDGERLTVSLGAGEPESRVDGVVSFTVSYSGTVVPKTARRKGNLEHLGAEGIYLRPGSGWYPRPENGGALRGTLSVIVPNLWSAAASGRLVGQTPVDEETRAFTWGLTTPAEPYLAAAPYKVSQRITASGVAVRTFLYPHNSGYAESYLREAERVLSFFSEKVAPYPYPNLTLAEVDRFYFSGLSARCFVLLDRGWVYDPEKSRDARDLLAHEISHQWWGEMIPVLTDPEWYLWEGLATYSEALYAESREGRAELTRQMREKAGHHLSDALSHPGWSIREADVRTEDWHETFVYEKGAWLFHMVRFLVGDEPFFFFLRSWLDLHAGTQPGSPEFQELLTTIAVGGEEGRYLEDFVEKWVDGTETVDLHLSGVSVRPTSGGGSEVEFELTDEGSGEFPLVEMGFTLADGHTETWLTAPGRHSLVLPGEVAAIEADPNFRILDLERSDNRYLILAGLAVPEMLIESVSSAAEAAGGLAAAALAIFLWVRGRRRRAGTAGGPSPPDAAGPPAPSPPA